MGGPIGSLLADAAKAANGLGIHRLDLPRGAYDEGHKAPDTGSAAPGEAEYVVVPTLQRPTECTGNAKVQEGESHQASRSTRRRLFSYCWLKRSPLRAGHHRDDEVRRVIPMVEDGLVRDDALRFPSDRAARVQIYVEPREGAR